MLRETIRKYSVIIEYITDLIGFFFEITDDMVSVSVGYGSDNSR